MSDMRGRGVITLLGGAAAGAPGADAQRAGELGGQRENGGEMGGKIGAPKSANETHLKRLISDAVFEAHHTHGRQAAGDRLHISREDSLIIASAVFDALRRANVLLIDQSGHSRPEA